RCTPSLTCRRSWSSPRCNDPWGGSCLPGRICIEFNNLHPLQPGSSFAGELASVRSRAAVREHWCRLWFRAIRGRAAFAAGNSVPPNVETPQDGETVDQSATELVPGGGPGGR